MGIVTTCNRKKDRTTDDEIRYRYRTEDDDRHEFGGSADCKDKDNLGISSTRSRLVGCERLNRVGDGDVFRRNYDYNRNAVKDRG